jgi:hypothetical protein
MNFSIGELVFNSNFKDEYISLRSGLNATEVTAYQYLGMTCFVCAGVGDTLA